MRVCRWMSRRIARNPDALVFWAAVAALAIAWML